MKYDIDIEKIDPFGEEDWDEVEAILYRIYFGITPKIVKISDSIGNQCNYNYLGVSFTDDVSIDTILRKVDSHYRVSIDSKLYSINSSENRISELKQEYRDSKVELSNLGNNIAIVRHGKIIIGKAKHVRKDRWVILYGNNNYTQSMSSFDYNSLLDNGYLVKGSTLYVSKYNRGAELFLLKRVRENVKYLREDIKEKKSEISSIENQRKTFDFSGELKKVLKNVDDIQPAVVT